MGVLTLIIGPSFKLGFAGKVEKGPSWTDRLLGGLPRIFPVEGPLLPGQALDTAGPRRFRDGPDDDFPAEVGFADLGSSNEGLPE